MSKQVKSTSKTTETSIKLVEALRELDGATLDGLADHLGLSKSTVHRHLATLRKHNYVVREDGEYHVGLQFLTVGGGAQRRVTAYPMIKEKVDDLACQTGERAQFIVEENGERVYLYTEVGETAVQTGAHIGKRGVLHTSAAGKTILAHMPQGRVEEILDEQGLREGTDESISTRAELFDELERVREQGYALNEQETTHGVNAVGTAVLDAEGEVLGALSVSGPASRLKGDRLTEDALETVLSEANELELYIEHSVEH